MIKGIILLFETPIIIILVRLSWRANRGFDLFIDGNNNNNNNIAPGQNIHTYTRAQMVGRIIIIRTSLMHIYVCLYYFLPNALSTRIHLGVYKYYNVKEKNK